MLNEIPVIKIELQGLRHTVVSMLTTRNDELNDLVIKSIEQQINEDWVVGRINETVREMLEQAIKDISSNWELKNAIRELVCESITKIISKEPQ